MMTNAARLAVTVVTSLAISACNSDAPVEPRAAAPLATAANLEAQGPNDWEGGAFVLNAGQGKADPVCFFQGFQTVQGTLVRTPSGNWTLNCSFEGLPPIEEEQTLTDWRCSIIGAPLDITHQSSWVRTTLGTAHLDCHYSGKPIEDAVVQFGDVAAAAQQGSFSLSLREFPGQQVSGEPVNIGLGCSAVGADLTGMIAVAERGVCTFNVKAQNALNAGAIGIIVYNSAPFGDQIIVMGGTPVAIPAVFVGRSTGLAILAAVPAPVTISFCNRSASCRGEL